MVGDKMPFNGFLVVVGYNRAIRDTPEKVKMGDPDRFVLFGRVSADMGMEPPVPERGGVKYVGVQVLGPANLRALGKGRTWAQAIKDAREKLSTS